MMEVVYELKDKHINDLHNLYKNEWWTNARTAEQTKQCVEGSQVCIGIVENNELIGFVRVITDYTFKALILDLIVKEEYRSKTLGKKLMHLVKEHKALKQVIHFELYCLPELISYYRQFGFTDDTGGVELIRCINA